jgi:hypothetical protein
MKKPLLILLFFFLFPITSCTDSGDQISSASLNVEAISSIALHGKRLGIVGLLP